MQQLSHTLYPLLLLCCLGLLGIHSPTSLQAQTYDVVWTDLVNTTATGNDLEKTAGGNGYNAGAASTNVLPANTDGWAEFRVGAVGGGRRAYPFFRFGLSTSNTDATANSIEYSVYIHMNKIDIYEGTVSVGDTDYISSNDTIRLHRIGSNIEYSVNGTVIHTSSNVPTGSMLVDVSIYKQGSQHIIYDAVTSFDVGNGSGPCEDLDEDGYYVGSGCDFNTVNGPDCDDDNVNEYTDCSSVCEDSDGDGYYVGCDDYTGYPSTVDCDDTNPNEFLTNCGDCVDADQDGYYINCDSYVGLSGEDCDDTNSAVTICTGGDIACGWTENNGDVQISTGKVSVGATDMTKPGIYKLYVQGGILTEGLTTGVKNTSDWSDYVFAEDYQRLTLQEVQAFVLAHKHLPNVPSAAEVVEKGVNVAQMDAILLRQIEELWLHFIDLQKQNEATRLQNKALRQQVVELIGELEGNQ